MKIYFYKSSSSEFGDYQTFIYNYSTTRNAIGEVRKDYIIIDTSLKYNSTTVMLSNPTDIEELNREALYEICEGFLSSYDVDTWNEPQIMEFPEDFAKIISDYRNGERSIFKDGYEIFVALKNFYRNLQ